MDEHRSQKVYADGPTLAITNILDPLEHRRSLHAARCYDHIRKAKIILHIVLMGEKLWANV